jgi:MFS family permease
VAVIFLGTAVLAVSSLMAALAPPEGGSVLLLALFLLGLGWNFGFVAGSALLSSSLEIHERTHPGSARRPRAWGRAS